jgi:hypothetical protein
MATLQVLGSLLLVGSFVGIAWSRLFAGAARIVTVSTVSIVLASVSLALLQAPVVMGVLR